ncbi:hypothetical protein SOCE836_086860 [Sorangium cellulosum]|uniref:Uncharacterized protein n=2 Tax=Polyangiaceae TaxID=49 RepID=A0A4P2R1F2_SORCE|nr:hypothetical protein SOCE836_086860 [Sorangium cellulosum]WCQ95776.1 hypothetical protein NQZ70_08553 [Sorangium sp. Soce836]
MALGLAAAPALADDPPGGGAAAPHAPRDGGAAAAEAPSGAAPSAAAPRSALRGAVVVAVDDASAEAARALARALYRDPALRPPIDEAAAQVLTGDPPRPDAPAAVKELAEVRRSAGRAESEPVARSLLASLGAGAGAALVVAVTTAHGHPVARVLRVAGASYAPLELGATVQRAAGGAAAPAATTADGAAAPAAATFDWPGAGAAVRALLAGDARAAGATDRAAAPPASAHAAPQRGPVGPRAGVDLTASKAPAGDQGAPAQRSMWSSPWFWGPLAGVVATGIVVLVLAQTSDGDGDTVHLRGRIAP